jgi:predicted DCC family thiol-disulfide oxidoreductase YuxK
MSDPTPRLEVIYDGECPFCTSYVEYCRLKEAFPDVTLTNARDIPDRVAAFRADGMDVDQGMIVIYGDAVYFGDKAMPALSVPVYVVLRTGRNLTLALLGRKKIGRAEKEGEA